MAHISTRNTSVIGCARSYRALRDGIFEGHFPRHFVPGYDHAVPLGQNPVEALIKLALMGLKPWAMLSSPFGPKTTLNTYETLGLNSAAAIRFLHSLDVGFPVSPSCGTNG
jgi:hypothetical protein